MTTSEPTALVVGGYGMLGTAIAERLAGAGWTVLRSSRKLRPEPEAVVLDALTIPALPALDAVCWAQGVNVNDAVDSFTDSDLERLLDANVVVPARQLRDLLGAGRLRDGASAVLISSIWEQVARADKFSYTISKAAVGGLVRAAALDLADRGIRVNGILPGVVDSPMTRSMLSPAQLEQVAEASGHNRLVTAADVADLVVALCAGGSGVTGQSLLVDLGFTIARRI